VVSEQARKKAKAGRASASAPSPVPHTRKNPCLLAALCCLPSFLYAESGMDLGASSSREEYVYASGNRSVTAQKITVTPWWRNDDWRLSASLPLVAREESSSGTVLVWRIVNRRLVQVPVTLTGSEQDTGLADITLRATRRWQASDDVTMHVGTFLTLPTGDDNAGTLSLSSAQTQSSRQGSYSLGSGATELGASPGITFATEKFWATAEAGAIYRTGDGLPASTRPLAYAGIGFSPWQWLEFSVAQDFEGESVDGGGDFEQTTFAVTLMPTQSLAISLSTFNDNSATPTDSNMSLSVTAHW
jgi:hypothetical protein